MNNSQVIKKMKELQLKEYLGGSFEHWVFAGGGDGVDENDDHVIFNKSYYNYWLMFHKNHPHLEKPLTVDRCGCDTKIRVNCYVWNKINDELAVVGSCCIKRFISSLERRCDKCGKVHKNRKHNFCNDCGKVKGKWLDEKAIKSTLVKKKDVIISPLSDTIVNDVKPKYVRCTKCKATIYESTSHTSKNPGRKFFSCKTCNVFEWSDVLFRKDT